MGLFSKKRKVQQGAVKRPALGSFPEFPRYESSLPEVRRYGHELNKDTFQSVPYNIPEEPRQEPSFSFPDLDIPKRRPSSDIKTQEEYPRDFDFPEQRIIPIGPERGSIRADDALFVRIEEYKKSIDKIRHVKELVKEAEKILAGIQNLKTEEDKYLSNWHQEITEIKTKLMEIDKDLFEFT